MDESGWVAPSLGSALAFVFVLALVAGAFVFAMAKAFGSRGWLIGAASAIAWLAITGAYVLGGLTRAGAPGLVGFFLLSNGAAIAFALSPIGARVLESVPLTALAGFQLFRLPLELVLHSWGEQGTMPVQMTFEGDNFDIVTGIAALLVVATALVTKREAPRWMLFAFNALGTALLIAVMVIVVRSSPLPLKAYEGPPILLALHLPYAWIAPVCVAGALAGHLMLWRALLRRVPRSLPAVPVEDC
jgi:hypothetical protein